MKALVLVIACWLLLPAGGWAQAGGLSSQKVAVIELKRVLQNSAVGKAAAKHMEDSFKQRREALEREGRQLSQLESDLQKQAAVLSQAALRERGESLQKRRVEFQRNAQDLREDFQRRHNLVMEKVLQEIEKTIAELAQQDGYEVILGQDERVVVYAQPRLDVSEDLIKLLNTKSISF